MKKPTKASYLIFYLSITLLLLFLIVTTRDPHLKNELKNSRWEFQTSDIGAGKVNFYKDTVTFDFDKEQLSGTYTVNSFSKDIKIITKKRVIEISITTPSKSATTLTGAMKGVKGAEENYTSVLLNRVK